MHVSQQSFDETTRIALTAAFLAAIVVSGLALTLVPNVELVTLTTFAAGMVLGPARGAWTGALGRALYHFAAGAVYGLPPSIPFLIPQVAGMALVGAAGGWWRMGWVASRRRWILLAALVPIGATLAFLQQVLLNLVGAALMASSGSFPGLFWAGMAFGAVQIIANAVIFALGGPPTAHVLRRAGRARGWWAWGVAVAALVLPASVRAQEAVPAPARAEDSLPDSSAAEPTVPAPRNLPQRDAGDRPASADTSAVAVDENFGLRPIELHPAALWRSFDGSAPARLGTASFLEGIPLHGRTPAESPAPGMATPSEAWGLGWGRAHFDLDGVPLAGPVHGWNEPPDVPQSWAGAWREYWTATGTRIDVGAMPRRWPQPTSRIAMTSGTFGRRTTEFALFRNLKGMNVGANYADREETDASLIGRTDASRLWLRVESVPGRRPDWTIDLATGSREHNAFGGTSLTEESRRVQFALRGPLAGGSTRIALQLRRHALRLDRVAAAEDVVRFDGYALQGDWATPVPGGALRVRWDRDRRRGALDDERTFDGVRGIALFAARLVGWDLGMEAGGGHQDPWGGTWSGAVALSREGERASVRFSAAHEEVSPAMVLALDGSAPEYGLGAHLETVESAPPERVDAVRAEVRLRPGRSEVTVGGWVARHRDARRNVVPLWTPIESPYAPAPALPGEADVLGAYAAASVPLIGSFHGEGRARASDRALAEVPYLPQWNIEGALHWKRRWFHGSLDLDAAIGGELLGPRVNPGGERYPTAAVGHLRVTGRIDRGTVTFAVENLADSFLESSYREADFTTPALIPGRRFLIGLTLVLED